MIDVNPEIHDYIPAGFPTDSAAWLGKKPKRGRVEPKRLPVEWFKAAMQPLYSPTGERTYLLTPPRYKDSPWSMRLRVALILGFVLLLGLGFTYGALSR